MLAFVEQLSEGTCMASNRMTSVPLWKLKKKRTRRGQCCEIQDDRIEHAPATDDILPGAESRGRRPNRFMAVRAKGMQFAEENASTREVLEIRWSVCG